MWSISPQLGTIARNGKYTAPSSIPVTAIVVVKAASKTDPTKFATAQVTLDPSTPISLAPASVTLYESQSQQFTASSAVSWSLTPQIGEISSAGLYTAPPSIASATNVVLTATSIAEPAKSATAVIAVQPGPTTTPISISVSLAPASVSLNASQSQQFTATVGGTTQTGVTWTVTPQAGTISSGGLYTAPSSIAALTSVAVTATSIADPTKSASATISLQPTVSITLAPSSVSLRASQTQQFVATVGGAAQTGVSWSLNPPVGTISASGLYTAPATISTAQNVMLTATSAADATKTAVAIIALAVTAPLAISITSPLDGAQVSGRVAISATATGSLAGVWLYADGVPLTGQLVTSPFATTWDTAPVQDGAHSISAVAMDASGNRSTTTISVSVKNAAVSQVTLPLEVMGPSGYTATAQVNLPSLPAGTLRLWLQIHGLKYQTEASVQVNNSAWMPINDSTATLLGLASNYGGIGGGFSTLKLTMTLPAGAVVAGANTIRFRFNGTDGVVSGFRILDFNIVAPDGTAVLNSSSFVKDDPATWRAPSSLAADISAGKSLWSTAALTIPGGVSIRAKCADCHAQDGRDLKYFNYSNYSIRVRSMFHGLTEQQGDQIASYIRSLNAPAPATARPWNPPYQPGPGLDAAPVANWAAGAGLGAVLDRDIDMLNYLAPGENTSSWAATGNVNVREIPITFQLPDWNNWLPRVHPLDGWGTLFTSAPAAAAYSRLRANLSVGNAETYKRFYNDFDVLGDNTFMFPYTLPHNNPTWTPELTNKVYAFPLWVLVKQWELNQEFQLDGLGQAIHGPRAEARAWAWDNAFFASPNMLHIPVGTAGLHNGNSRTWHYLAFAWYQQQLILNYSNYNATGRPIDWGYALAAVGPGISWNNSVPQASMLQLWMIKALQMSEFDPGMETGVNGWNPEINIPSLLVDPNFQVWPEYSISQRGKFSEAYLRHWFARIKMFTPQQFYTGGFASPTETVTPNFNERAGSRLNYALRQLHYYGVSTTLLNQVADWAKTIWPLGNWDATKTVSCTSPDGGRIVNCVN